MTEALTKAFTHSIRDWRGSFFSRKRQIEKEGGTQKYAKKLASRIMTALYSASFTGSPSGIPYAVPFIASFCAHGMDEQYEQQNGLLSQWRGYGGDERFALAFDTAMLAKLVREEDKRFAYALMEFARVTYNENIDFSSVYQEIIAKGKDILTALLDGGDRSKIQSEIRPIIMPFLEATTTLKHRGFKEENEVRIVASPMTEEHFRRLADTSGSRLLSGRILKPTLSKPSKIKSMRYIRLFDWMGNNKLPVTRIIVGPHSNQARLVHKAEQLVGRAVAVQRSETPFVG